MQQSVGVYDRSSRIVYLNAATERLFGFSFSDAQGERLWDRFPNAVGNPFYKAFERVAAGGARESLQHYYAPFDAWFMNTIELVGNHVHVIAQDVTDDVRRTRRLDTITRISTLFAMHDLGFEAALQCVADILSDVLDAECGLLLPSHDGRWLDVVATASKDPESLQIARRISRWDANVGHAAKALRTRSSLLVNGENVMEELPGVLIGTDVIEQYRASSLLAAPLLVHDQAIGVLVASRREGKSPLTQHDCALVTEVASSVGLYIAHAARAQSEQRVTRRLQSLLDVTVKLAAASSADEIARVVVDQGVEALDADSAGMWLLADDGKTATMQRHRGFAPQHQDAFVSVPLDASSPVSDCCTNARAVWIRSRAEYQRLYPEHEKRHRAPDAPPLAFALLPLVIEGRTIGCVTFSFHDEDRLTPDEQTYFEVLASHTAEALRRSRLYTQLRDVSETRAAMIQASPAAIMLTDAKGVVQAWNPAAEHIFGWPAEEVLGRPLVELGLGFEAEFEDNLRKVLAGTSVDRQVTKRVRRSGEAFAVEMYAVPVSLSDDRTLCLSMVFDVSERARIEAGRRLVSKATALLTRSLNASQSLTEVVALVAGDFGGWCAVEVRDAQGQISRVQSERALARAVGAGECTVPLEVGDRVVGTLSVGSSVRAFDSLDLLIIADLAHHIATATDNARLYEDARKARHEAEAASGAKDEFLAMLGHELRNPLAPISTALHLMGMRAPDQFEPERNVIERQVEHLRLLVDDLLDISRITRGKVELNYEHTRICDVVVKAIETTSPLLEQRQHRLVVDVPESLAVVGDAMRLGQVVTNLVSNAAKYTDKGGEITVQATRKGDDVLLSVRDDGIGMRAEMLPIIFDMFVQAPQSSERKSGGLGLGLAIVRTLVAMHKGTVAARSAGLGRGSEFIVTLPAAPADSTQHAYTKKATPQRLAARPKRVLVVDDNEDAASLLSELLTLNGYHVSTAFDGPSALEAAEVLEPEVAVLDIGLPVMDGYELAQRLRARHQSLRLLIALTGYGQPSDRERSAAAGFAVHLAKPVSVDQILRLLEEPV